MSAALRKSFWIFLVFSVFAINSGFGEGSSESAEHVFNLEYKPSGFSIYANVNFPISDHFEKEPDFSGQGIFRGIIMTGREEKDGIAFIWDKSEGKLFIDINGNRDLTDDVSGEIRTSRKGFYQRFDGINLDITVGTIRVPFAFDITFYRSAGCNCQVRSGFSGKIELHESKWYFAVADNMDGEFEGIDQFFLVPLEDDSYKDLQSYPLSLAREVFFDGRNYDISYEYISEEKPKLQVTFTETVKPLGELNFQGKFIKRMILESDSSAVLIDSPETKVSAPSGKYHYKEIFLDGGDEGLFRADSSILRPDEITIKEDEVTDLKMGGPLDNTVEVKRAGRVLQLSYRPVGAGGLIYSEMGRRGKPAFTIYKGDKKIASGSFEYG